jgi:S-adenosylmethionine synthetase
MKTAEFVTPKHVDKICDQISDFMVDYCISMDKHSRVAVETMGGHGKITLTGEVTSAGTIDYEYVEQKIQEIIGHPNFTVEFNLVQQSPEIARGVDVGGAGDQGIMVGYATSETPTFIPMEYYLANNLCKKIYDKYPYDGKVQVTIGDDDKVFAVTSSFQNVSSKDLENEIRGVLGDGRYIVNPNPAGDWEIGGFDADSGVTGRKLVIDSYGPRVPVGGGAFSGKDPTKVDRSAAYMARKIAVDYVVSKGAREAKVYLAYGIGLTVPYQAEVIIDGKVEKIDGYDLSPSAIIEFLKLREQDYQEISKWGHFTNPSLNWNNPNYQG